MCADAAKYIAESPDFFAFSDIVNAFADMMNYLLSTKKESI